MACRYYFGGQEYDEMGFAAALRNMAPSEAVKHMPGIQSVPDLPFEKTWPELAVKRVIRWAAENSYDRIAWPPGSVHAERYSLERQIGDLRWERDPSHWSKPEPTWTLTASRPGGGTAFAENNVSAGRMAELVGQDVAARITGATEEKGRLSGLDLRVGGEGMRGFYDQILPSVAQKLGKKFGARVGTSEIGLPNTTNTARTGQRLQINEFAGQHYVVDTNTGNRVAPTGIEGFSTRAEAEQALQAASSQRQTVHSMDITPAMRASVVEKGQPLFAGVPFDPASAALGAGAGAASGTDENGETDPLRTGVGAVAAGILNRRGHLPPVNGINPKALARGIQQAAKGVQAVNQVPGLPIMPPNAKPGMWQWAQTWRYGVGLFGQLSTAMMQAGGGLGEVALGAPTEAIRQGIIRGHPEHLPLIAWEGLKSLPGGAVEGGKAIAGKVPQVILNSSDYRPPMSSQLSGPAKGVAFAMETPGRIATQAPDAAWYEVFHRTGIAQAAAEEAQKQLGSARSLVGSGVGALAGGVTGYTTAPDDSTPAGRVARTVGGAVGGGMAGRGIANISPRALALQHQLIANPTPEMLQRAHQLAQDATYKGDLGALGQLGEMIVKGPPASMLTGLPPEAQRVLSVYREIASHFMPVYHTIARITEGGAEFVPGLGALPLNKIGLAAKATPLDEKLARQATGLMLTMGALGYAASGGIRGPGPSDPDVLQEMRDQGYETNTTNIGGLWVQNSALGRPGVILNMIGALNDAMVYGDGKDTWKDISEADPYFRKRVGMLVNNLGRAWSDYPTASAFSTLTKIWKDPEAGLAELAGSTASQYVPGVVKTYATATDPKVRRPDRDPNGNPLDVATDTFAQRSGIGRQSLPAAQDRLGREVENQRQGWAALFPRVGRDRHDPIIQAFIDSKVEIPRKRDKITIDGLEIELPPPMQRKWQEYMGAYLLKETPKTLRSAFWNRPTTSVGDRGDELRDLSKEAADDATERVQDDLGAAAVNRLLKAAEAKKARQRGEATLAR